MSRLVALSKSALKWLVPGLKVKRWLLIALMGLLLIISGTVIIGNVQWNIRGFINQLPLSPLATGLFLCTLGLILLVSGYRRMIRSLIDALMPIGDNSLVETVIQKRQLKKGPKIVVIGGGTGLGVMLRGLKKYTSNITAIVTVSDDGGSSGRLRGELGILPPGDIRNCLMALADRENLMEEVFNHRFKEGAELKDHSVGNILLAAMTEITGDFNKAIQEVSKVLAIRGQVLPATLANVTLVAKMVSGKIIRGESNIGKAGLAIGKVSLEPNNPKPLPEALAAIAEADVVVLGPGSLYTSVIPNLLVQGIPQALLKTEAPIIYICNVMTQPGETGQYTASQHLKAIIDHSAHKIVDYMVVNTEPITKNMLEKYHAEGARPVKVDEEQVKKMGVQLVKANLVNQSNLVRHDGDGLAKTIIKLVFAAKQPLGKLF